MLKIPIYIGLYIFLGALFVLGVAIFKPSRLVDRSGFRQDIAFWLLFVYPAPIFLALIRLLILPAKKLSQRFKLPEEPVNEN